MYILRAQVLQIDGRLCHFVLAFLSEGEHYKQQGPLLRSTRHYSASVATTDPSATLSPSIVFPVRAGYTIYLALGARFLSGTRRASPVARHVLAHRWLSLPPRRDRDAASRQISASHAALRPSVRRLDPRIARHFRGHLRVHFRYGPVTRDLPKANDLVDRLQSLAYCPPPCYPTIVAPARLLPRQVCLLLNMPAFAGHTTGRSTLSRHPGSCHRAKAAAFH